MKLVIILASLLIATTSLSLSLKNSLEYSSRFSDLYQIYLLKLSEETNKKLIHKYALKLSTISMKVRDYESAEFYLRFSEKVGPSPIRLYSYLSILTNDTQRFSSFRKELSSEDRLKFDALYSH